MQELCFCKLAKNPGCASKGCTCPQGCGSNASWRNWLCFDTLVCCFCWLGKWHLSKTGLQVIIYIHICLYNFSMCIWYLCVYLYAYLWTCIYIYIYAWCVHVLDFSKQTRLSWFEGSIENLFVIRCHDVMLRTFGFCVNIRPKKNKNCCLNGGVVFSPGRPKEKGIKKRIFGCLSSTHIFFGWAVTTCFLHFLAISFL